MTLRYYSNCLKWAMPFYKLPLASKWTHLHANNVSTNKQNQNPVYVSTLEGILINGSSMID